jgi:hypothetical protein
MNLIEQKDGLHVQWVSVNLIINNLSTFGILQHLGQVYSSLGTAWHYLPSLSYHMVEPLPTQPKPSCTLTKIS